MPTDLITENEAAGMAWWNGLSVSSRGAWLAQPGATTIAHAWALRQRMMETERERLCVAEQAARDQRIIDEANEYIVSSEDSIIVGAIADLIQEHPHLFAMRFLRVEREVEELRLRLDDAMRTPVLRCQEVAP